MHFSALLFASLATSALAYSNSTLSNSTTYSNTSDNGLTISTLYANCHTRIGHSSVSVIPTSTLATTAYSTVSVNTTFTPAASTVYPAALNQTVVLTVTATADAETTTLTVPGSTITTLPGFTPIASLYATTTTVLAPEIVRRTAGHPHASPTPTPEPEVGDDECEWDRPEPYGVTRGHNQTRPVWNQEMFPQEVTCYLNIEIISTSTLTLTSPPTTITALPSTITYDSYTTTTTTPVIYATVTPAAIYEGCQADNIVSTINGEAVYGVSVINTSDTFDFVSTGTAYECCVACLNDAICGGATFLGAGTCVLIHTTTCNIAAKAAEVLVEAGSATGPTASNGYCGYLV